jgi:prepilin-type N-terminal cleavage/methylation domain-containing protein
MNVQQKQMQKGFTIIEVVLVLAIAGLIFLMVFIALPALQRNQRDTQRRSDVGTFVSQLQSYSTNHKGAVPASSTDLKGFMTGYLKSDEGGFKDPSTGEAYAATYDLATADNLPKTPGAITYRDKATCSDSGDGMVASTNARSAAVVMKLEGSGYYCQSNQ